MGVPMGCLNIRGVGKIASRKNNSEYIETDTRYTYSVKGE